MTAKHPPAANPNRGYSFVGQESISSISGYDKGLPQGKSIRDIKVTTSCMISLSKAILTRIGNT
jgi:hypothetical protein